MSVCRSCNAPVVWCETVATETKPARKMPLDATPDGRALEVANGNIAIVGRTGAGTPMVRYVKAGAGKYVSHFSSCPNAASHRKTKR